jgi:ABC-type transport system involved in cytochrome c biogenesis permease component
MADFVVPADWTEAISKAVANAIYSALPGYVFSSKTSLTLEVERNQIGALSAALYVGRCRVTYKVTSKPKPKPERKQS